MAKVKEERLSKWSKGWIGEMRERDGNKDVA